MMPPKKYMPDDIDKKIVAELQKDGRTSYKVIAKKLNLSDGTIRLRTAKMIKNNFLKISATVNPFFYENSITALIGLNLEKRDHKKIMQKIARINGVKSVTNSTGRYDLLAEVFFHSREELRLFLMENITKVGGIMFSETYVYLEAINKRVEFF